MVHHDHMCCEQPCAPGKVLRPGPWHVGCRSTLGAVAISIETPKPKNTSSQTSRRENRNSANSAWCVTPAAIVTRLIESWRSEMQGGSVGVQVPELSCPPRRLTNKACPNIIEYAHHRSETEMIGVTFLHSLRRRKLLQILRSPNACRMEQGRGLG